MLLVATLLSFMGLTSQDADNHTVSIPLSIRNVDGEVSTAEFRFEYSDPNAGALVTEFCEERSITSQFCALLLNEVKKVIAERNALLSSRKDLTSVDDKTPLPNAHLERYISAMSAERKRVFHPADYDTSLFELESRIHNMYAEKWTTTETNTSSQQCMESLRICFIHSCTLEENSHRILESLLLRLNSSGLLHQLNAVIVMNSGYPVSSNLSAAYPMVDWIEVHHDTSYFEIPTLRLIRKLGIYLQNHYADKNAQILYLHTKGVSYRGLYPQIEDWRDMMLYFLVDKYPSCYHLLRSEEIDAIGVNYKSMPCHMFSGNFWWSTARHIARLPNLDYAVTGKYESECWLLNSTIFSASDVGPVGDNSVPMIHHTTKDRIPDVKKRIFVPHNTNIDHAKKRYPQACYRVPASWSDPLTVVNSTGIQQEVGHSKEDECGVWTTARERKYWVI